MSRHRKSEPPVGWIVLSVVGFILLIGVVLPEIFFYPIDESHQVD